MLLTFSSLNDATTELNLKNELLENYRNDIKPAETIDLKVGMALRALNNINQIDGTGNYRNFVINGWDVTQVQDMSILFPCYD